MKCPNLLKCIYYKIDNYGNINERMVKDYEIDYYITGDRIIYIDNIKYTIEPNSIILKKPGQTVSGYGKFNCYMLTLDFSNKQNNKDYKRNLAGNIQEISNNDLIAYIPTYFKPKHDSEIRSIFKLLSVYCEEAKSGNLNPIIMELLCLLSADSYSIMDENKLSSDDLTSICRYMQKHYNENISVESLAKRIHLNKSYFIRKFKNKFGISPLKYLSELKLNNAKILLQNTDYSNEEIAILCGFCNPSYFSQIFKRENGVTPGDYRKKFYHDNQ